jgi:hypothetical protein
MRVTTQSIETEMSIPEGQPSRPVDILILSNGPGEVSTWVRPVVKALRDRLGHNRSLVRISLVLSPCPNSSGQEVAIAQTYSEIDRIQGAADFFPFLLWGKTADSWDWRDCGVVVFLGGDQFFPVVIGKRLGYRTVIYGEWDTRWHGWINRFGVMKSELIERVNPRYAAKFEVVGDLMAEVGHGDGEGSGGEEEWIGLLPGSKAAKLMQGLPLALAIAHHIQTARPQTHFVIPVAPTLSVEALAQFANLRFNPVSQYFGAIEAHLDSSNGRPVLVTNQGLTVNLWTGFPAYDVLSRCRLCLTTVGANTAELGALAVPMLVLLPTQQLDAMRAWDGLPGLLANLPGLGTAFAKLINGWFLRKSRLLAWPNIWAGEAIVPELVGKLQPQQVADLALNLLEHPEQLEIMRQKLRQVRGKPGAASKLARMVGEELASRE